MKTVLVFLSVILFLSSGVISESSTSAPSTTSATPACTNGKLYTTCGTMCPLTCENKDNPPSICPLACKIGCICPQGMVEDGERCVTPEECPATTVCTNGKVHTECGSACPLTCANKDNPPSCIQECVSGCFCPNDMVISNEGSCVNRQDCSAPACTNGKVHTECGSACPLTCANKDNPPSCIQECVSGCFCPDGMVISNEGSCVNRQDCPVTTTTPNNCTLPPVPGMCKASIPSFFYNSTSKKCESFIYGGCGGNANRFETQASCMSSCGNEQPTTPSPTTTDAPYKAPYVEPPLSCPETDVETFGACVIQSECMSIESGATGGCDEGHLCCSTGCGGILCNEGVTPSPLCSAVKVKAENASRGLLGAYIPQCEEDGSFSKVQCSEGYCWCVDTETGKSTGVFALGSLPQCDEELTTVTPTATNTPACTNGKVYTTCGTMCPLTCENKDSPPLMCPLACKIGCICPQGKVENGEGCVAPEECPATTTTSTKPSYCQLSPVSGLCEAYMPSFFYNSTSMKCESFVYGGCGGNDNRFDTKSKCMETCGDEVTVSTSTVPTPPEPETLTEAVYAAQKVCPAVGDALGPCEEHCTSDGDCEDWEMCCSNGCGHSCVDSLDVPYYSPPMQCPQLLLPICNFHFACSSHDECNDQYCCSTGCGAMCMTGVEKTPACAAIKDSVQSKGLIGAYEPQCDETGNFTALQCHSSTGMCWCVDTETGKPLTTPVTAQQPECEQITQEDKCKGIQCDWPNCGEDIQPIMDDDHCCPYCPATCQVGDTSYPSGSSYTAPDGCNTCSCYNGISACTLMACMNQCTYNGKKYNQGQNFNSTDGCNTCFCDSNGGVACTEKACVFECNAGGMQMREGQKKDDGCSECVCQGGKIICTMSENGCDDPKTKSIDITMKFNADFDSISDDIEGFKTSFKTSLITKYQSLNLRESQIIINDVYRGSVVVDATLHDRMDNDDDKDDDKDDDDKDDHHGHHDNDDGDNDHHDDDDDHHDDDDDHHDDDDESSLIANITLLIIQLEQDYNSNDLVINYQDMTFEPSGELTYQDSDEGEDDEEEDYYFWSYVGLSAVFVVTVALMVVIIVVAMVMMKRKNRRRNGMSPLPTKDEFDDYKLKGFSNPVYASKSTTVNM